MKRFPFLGLLGHAFLNGATAALVANAIWITATGQAPSLLTSLVCAQAATTVWALVQAARFRRKWQTVLASYNQPALGQGIDIPHRPPVDDEEGKR